MLGVCATVVKLSPPQPSINHVQLVDVERTYPGQEGVLCLFGTILSQSAGLQII
jgi:hypothetical protein